FPQRPGACGTEVGPRRQGAGAQAPLYRPKLEQRNQAPGNRRKLRRLSPPVVTWISMHFLTMLAAALLLAAPNQAPHPDGLYAEIRTSKGLMVARLEPDLTPLAVANFVGLAEGTIANAAFDLGRPFYDGTVYHRVVPGHVIQTGIPQSARARNPGYTFPNEIHARLSHNHAGALNMANGGPGTNASQFCIMLGDRSYLDGDFTVFGGVVEGLDVVMRIVQGDVVESV